ncbi:MAG: MraY family glycosyltransferase [bacterium]
MRIYFLVLVLAFVITYLITPVVKNLAFKLGAVDIPNDRKVHTEPTPRLGGLAIFFGYVLSIGSVLIFFDFPGKNIDFSLIIGIILSATLLLLVGIIDDIRGLRAMTKLFFQVLATLLVIWFGVKISFITNPVEGILPIGALAVPLTLLWVVGVTNAINLIDGLDGLATGVALISCVTLFIVAILSGQVGAAILLAALLGTGLAFLRFNFPPASIFLGDSGSLFLGFILATSAIVGVLKTTLVVALIVPVLILGVPIFDTLFAIVRRLKSGKNPFEADDRHIHHMLLRAGFDKREAVLAIYTVCFILSFIALIMATIK